MTEKKIPAIGSKLLVFRGLARHTSGGLTRRDLMRHKGRIISRKKHEAGKKAIKHLKNLGYIAKKGTFKLFRKSMVDGRKKTSKKHGKRHTRKRGGAYGSVSSEAFAAAGYAGKPAAANMAASK